MAQGTEVVIYEDGEWSGVYLDGKLQRVGDTYLRPALRRPPGLPAGVEAVSEIPVYYFDPEPEPLTDFPKFEVGDRIDMGDYVVTVTAILPSDDGTQSFRIALADD